MLYSTINLGNVFEFNYQHCKDTKWTDFANRSASDEFALFWGGDEKLVVVTEPINSLFFEDVKAILGYRNVQVVAPPMVSTSISRNAISFIDDIIQLIDINSGIWINPWGVTHEYYEFVHILERRGISVLGTHPPAGYAWTSSYFGSKIGSKLLMSHIQVDTCLFKLPRTLLLTTDLWEAEAATEALVKDGHSVVLKYNQEHGGRGVAIFPREMGASDIHDELMRFKSKTQFSDEGMMLLEEFVGQPNHNRAISIDVCVEQSGDVVLKPASMIYTKLGKEYVGLEIGLGVLESDVIKCVEEIALQVGQTLSRENYCGWFDIDFVMPKESGQIHIFGTEINARRTGGTQGITIAERLFGVGWHSRTALISIDRFAVKRSIKAYSDIRDALVNFNLKHGPTSGVIPISSRGLTTVTPYMSCIIYATHIEHARELRRELEELIGKE